MVQPVHGSASYIEFSPSAGRQRHQSLKVTHGNHRTLKRCSLTSDSGRGKECTDKEIRSF